MTLTLMPHQKKALTRPDRFCHFHDTGTGKTITALSLIDDRLSRGVISKALVICPLSVIESWEKDALHFPHLDVVAFARYKKAAYYREKMSDFGYTIEKLKKSEAIEICLEAADVVITNPETISRATKFANVINMVTGGLGVENVALVVDESSIIKSAKAKITKRIHKISDRCKCVWLLSGTPAPNNEFELWGQARAVSPDLLCRSNWDFKNRYGYQDRFKAWHLRPGSAEEITRYMTQVADYVEKSVVLKDLPPFTVCDRRAFLSQKSKDLKYEIEKIISPNGKISAPDLMRFREISSGFLYSEDEDGKREVIPIHDEKIRLLVEIIRTLKGRSVIIWSQFREEVRQIVEHLGAENCSIVGGSTSNHAEQLDNFRSGKTRYLIAHPRSAGYGVDGLQHICQDMIFYSASYSYEEYYQALSRLHRKGQKNAVTVYRMILHESVEETLWKAVENKQSIQDYVSSRLKMFV